MLRLNALVFLGAIAYAIIDKFIGIHVAPYIYFSFIVFAIANYILIKKGHIEISRFIGLLLFNLMVFIVASSEPFETGMQLQFVSVGAAALALYGFEQWEGAIGFVLLSLSLNILILETDFSIIPMREVGVEQAQVFAVINTVIAASVSVYTILLISKFDYDSEKSLKLNQKLINEKNNQLIKANKELDRFVYSASHDLRAPLSTLEGLINLIEITKDDLEIKEYLELMKLRIKKMNEFIGEIVAYSRNSRLELNVKPVKIQPFLKAIYEEHRFMTNFDRIEDSWDFQEDIIVNSDEMRLKMVFANIISNAIRYADQKKSQSRILFKGMVVDDKAIIKIEDNGLGIADELQAKVFEMFFRAREDAIGSGLGLYIVKETISKLSGEVLLESTESEGSSFSIILPLNKYT